MAENKNKNVEELQDEQLDEVAGGRGKLAWLADRNKAKR